ncbi:4469_t:CDS:2 [Entrophospora sp. SA101]|nr:4469_t:CDS:2 [Entrophospora sp. SA101]CAJ0864179.1 4294_t:CDS:2 [Entrophospora sp. SA101]
MYSRGEKNWAFTEELLGVFQEASLVAEANNDLKELVDLLDDSNIEYEDQQLLLDDLIIQIVKK